MRLSIDTNILAYSVDVRDRRIVPAQRIMIEAVVMDCFLTNQVIGEFLNVVRMKAPVSLEVGRQAATDWSLLFPILPTGTEHLIAAGALSQHHRLQFWDSVILTVCGANDVDYLITEDMQDGAEIAGVRILNPFNPANADLLDALLTPPPGTA